MKRVLFFVALFCPATASAGCLSMDTSNGWDAFVNHCNVGVDFDFSDEGSCSGYRCSGYVGPNSRFSVGSFTGYVHWAECESPGGNGDVITMCDASGNCTCKD